MATPNDTPAPKEPKKADCPSAPCSRSSDTPETDLKVKRICGNWNNAGDHIQEFVLADVARKLERERNDLQAAIKSAIIELCPPARPSQVRRILRKAMGQPEWQIYNDDTTSPANAESIHPESKPNDHE
jgi:hypothetical protein